MVKIGYIKNNPQLNGKSVYIITKETFNIGETQDINLEQLKKLDANNLIEWDNLEYKQKILGLSQVESKFVPDLAPDHVPPGEQTISLKQLQNSQSDQDIPAMGGYSPGQNGSPQSKIGMGFLSWAVKNEGNAIPDEVKGFNLAALIFNSTWAIFNGQIKYGLIMLFSNFVPVIGSLLSILLWINLALHGNEMAWALTGRWSDIEKYKQQQKSLSMIAIIIFVISIISSIITVLLLSNNFSNLIN